MYDAINDSRVRPSHLAMDGIIREVDDGFWQEHSPSNGFRCRCRLINLSEKQAQARSGNGKGLNKPIIHDDMRPDKGWDYNPGADLTKGVEKAISERPNSDIKSALVQTMEKSRLLLDNNMMKNVYRNPWHSKFPLVDIHAKEGKVKNHTAYDAAKTGDVTSAFSLVESVISKSKMKSLNRYRDLNPIVLPVVGLEGVSNNVIPNALAVYISKKMRFNLGDDIVQTTRAGHTGASGWWRLISQAGFSGSVVIGGNYILVDDFIGMGGTFANLRGYIESRGGKVIKTVSLTGKPRSANLGLTLETLEKLRNKYGEQLELWWKAIFGYGIENLTEAEANYLIRAESFNTIRDRLITAAEQGQ